MSQASSPDSAGPTGVVCSARGCREAAIWVIRWRNPRIHPQARSKQWTACGDHLDGLRSFLASRSFPLEVDAL